MCVYAFLSINFRIARCNRRAVTCSIYVTSILRTHEQFKLPKTQHTEYNQLTNTTNMQPYFFNNGCVVSLYAKISFSLSAFLVHTYLYDHVIARLWAIAYDNEQQADSACQCSDMTWLWWRWWYHADIDGHSVVLRHNRLGQTRLRSVRSASVSLRANNASLIASGEPYYE